MGNASEKTLAVPIMLRYFGGNGEACMAKETMCV